MRIVHKAPSFTPAPVYRRIRATDLPALMQENARRPHVPLTLLVKEWDDFPSERESMINEAPSGEDADDLCRIAAVVHALCERDSLSIPDWVWEHRSEVPIAWDRRCIMQGVVWDQTIENAPPACGYHNVWFDYQFISSARQRVTKDDYIYSTVR